MQRTFLPEQASAAMVSLSGLAVVDGLYKAQAH